MKSSNKRSKKLSHFQCDIRNNVVIAFFENIEHGNSFSTSAAYELTQLVKKIKKNKNLGLVISSRHKVFCSGGNLSDYANLGDANLKSKNAGLKINSQIKKSFEELKSLPIPTVCALTGDCFGGGLEWISYFDKIYASPHSLLGMWQKKLSLSWGWGGGYYLKQRVSKSSLKNLLLEGRTFSALHAKQIGLIDDIFPIETIFDEAIQYCLLASKLPSIPNEILKNSNLKDEEKVFKKLWMNEEHQKILIEFKNKKASKI